MNLMMKKSVVFCTFLKFISKFSLKTKAQRLFDKRCIWIQTGKILLLVFGVFELGFILFKNCLCFVCEVCHSIARWLLIQQILNFYLPPLMNLINFFSNSKLQVHLFF